MCPIKLSLFCLIALCILISHRSNADIHSENWDNNHHHTSSGHSDDNSEDNTDSTNLDYVAVIVIMVLVQLMVMGCIYLIAIAYAHRFNCGKELQKEDNDRKLPKIEEIICV